jgi:hypothetical protein
VPSIFISGKSDWGVYQRPGAVERMQGTACTRMVACHLLDGAGHWVQQEQARRVGELLVRIPSNAISTHQGVNNAFFGATSCTNGGGTFEGYVRNCGSSAFPDGPDLGARRLQPLVHPNVATIVQLTPASCKPDPVGVRSAPRRDKMRFSLDLLLVRPDARPSRSRVSFLLACRRRCGQEPPIHR